jgi:hypothetical protein
MFYLSQVTGKFHSYWIKHPFLFAGIMFSYALIVCILSFLLGVWTNFGPDKTYIGFSTINWGWLFPWAMPLSAVCVGFFLRVCSNAILSLDDIVVAHGAETSRFSSFILPRLKKGWRVVFWLSILSATVIVVVADGRDVFAPYFNINSAHKDWTTHGYTLNTKIRYLYFVFNIAAFVMEGILAYCGLLLVFGASSMLYWIITRLSLLEKKRRDILSGKRELKVSDTVMNHFRIEWDWDGLQGRCGLHEFDKVYGLYVLFIILMLICTAASIFWNIKILGRPDIGSWFLVVGPISIFPGAFFWILYPYWNYFPDSRPDDPKGEKKMQPVKWPFGSYLSWSFIMTAGGLWLYIVMSLLRHIQFLPKK